MRILSCRAKCLIPLILCLLFSLASCRENAPSTHYYTPLPSPMPTPTGRVLPAEKESPEEIGLTESGQAERSFEKFRQTALDCVPKDPGLGAAVTRFLIDYSEDTVILAVPVRGPDMEHDINGEDTAGKNSFVMEAAVCDYKLCGTTLAEGPYTIVPILVETENNTGQIKKVSVPDLHNVDLRKRDIIDIFGVESEEELGLFTNEGDFDMQERIWRGYEQKLCRLKCKIANAGGFSGLESDTVRIYENIKDSGYFDRLTEEGTIRAYFLENNFSYDMLCVPYWHELGRETEGGETTLYLAMYIGHIYYKEDGTTTTGSSSTVCKLKLDYCGGRCNVREYERFMGEGEEWAESIEAYLGGYAGDYFRFRETDEYADMIFNGGQMMDALAGGTFKPEEHLLPTEIIAGYVKDIFAGTDGDVINAEYWAADSAYSSPLPSYVQKNSNTIA